MGKQLDKKKPAVQNKDKKEKKTMKQQKKHKKDEKQVKDSQIKIGPTKKIAKLTKEAVIKKDGEKKSKDEKKPVSTEPLVQLRDNVKDSLAFVKKKQVDQNALKKAVKRLEDKANRVPIKDTPQNCTIYVGHLPYGLLEEQLKTYFEQYGTIVNIKVARSRKTARSKGFAFIQFEQPEVAAIAAKAMNGHMVLGKVLEVHVLQQDQKNPFSFKYGKKQFKFINWKRIFIKQKNSEKDPEEVKKGVEKLLKNEEKKRDNLKKLGIDYEFPGFKAIVDGKTVIEADD
ncbi:RNA recognition motif protein (macronuclear) [Tetrahymena thermophila SB210]|uniref:RNA recognition motif protein n=1 Tax=Tetrahymena thermophila (strain SB210) TaxID=312017 RepID=Q245K5_TETTS|nr:RNA recognition motif protein [Tetrahymena thermophila SB210]EAS03627.1 RNA recognition motif protein [Tetrahymena thermophila SB210]|eukprot:XP_001023873.1 RNA recognition motif protein [Tetrahymena thermophila SB210]